MLVSDLKCRLERTILVACVGEQVKREKHAAENDREAQDRLGYEKDN